MAEAEWVREVPSPIERLLAPLTPSEFIECYWGFKPIHLSGCPDRLDGLFSRRRFFDAIACARQSPAREGFSVGRFTQDFDGAWTCSEAIDDDAVEAVVAGGQTVCVRSIVAGDSALEAFGSAFKRALGLIGNIGFNAYYSGDGSGADMHFDRSITMALQIEGTKRWRFAKTPAVAWPPGNGRMQRDGTPFYAAPWFGASDWDRLEPNHAEMCEVVLHPGDILCLPAGTWHAAKAIGGSLALNMLFAPFGFEFILQRLCRLVFEDREAWRAGVPAHATADFPAGTTTVPLLASYLQDRLAELREALSDGRIARVFPELADEWIHHS